MAARLLLESTGAELTSASDAFTVARKVLVVQDTVELVLAALCIEVGSPRKVAEGVPFNELVAYVVKQYREQDDDEVQNRHRSPLLALNHARVRFKHHGDLLDPATTYPLVGEAIDVLDLLCERAVQMPLRQIDAVAAVVHEGIAEHLRIAETLAEGEYYRESLISIARAVKTAFWDYDVRGINTGESDSEAALLLSGRGIDPASFIAMQRFLPTLYSPDDEEPKFITREYGHAANWTAINARFCWNTALTIVLRLQYAVSAPQALDFYDEYEDVLTVTARETTCRRYHGFLVSAEFPTEVLKAERGDIFTGRAKGFYEVQPGWVQPEFPIEFEHASWIRLSNHNLRTHGDVFSSDELWFNREDVEIAYQDSRMAVARKKHLVELLEGTESSGDVTEAAD